VYRRGIEEVKGYSLYKIEELRKVIFKFIIEVVLFAENTLLSIASNNVADFKQNSCC
jgi:hypothetical protein